MSIGVFIDKNHCPAEAEIQEAIGSRLPLWQELAGHVQGTYPVEQDFKFMYGKEYGWALRYRVKGQLLTSFYPVAGGFTAQVNLSPQDVETAETMGLGDNACRAIAQATPYPEGRWLFIPVQTPGDCEDVQKLLALRAAAKHMRKKTASSPA
ncbi:MAG: DUF3788 family protein [Chloroflexi bacterium]|nr:DUF3788 family protein [Anaerolineaceae bacterium]NMB87483.1 DUF3788 family protein [Chloroflexota bacterium]